MGIPEVKKWLETLGIAAPLSDTYAAAIVNDGGANTGAELMAQRNSTEDLADMFGMTLEDAAKIHDHTLIERKKSFAAVSAMNNPGS